MNRTIKICLSGLVVLYLFIVCFNNIFDYGANFQFVTHVTSMDEIFSRQKNGWRALESSWVHHMIYVIIIIFELTTLVMIALGTIGMLKARRSDFTTFKRAGRFTTYGLTMGITLWFGAFLTIGGEWFLMWQTKSWNAQNNAFMLTMIFLLLLIHHQTDEK